MNAKQIAQNPASGHDQNKLKPGAALAIDQTLLIAAAREIRLALHWHRQPGVNDG